MQGQEGQKKLQRPKEGGVKGLKSQSSSFYPSKDPRAFGSKIII